MTGVPVTNMPGTTGCRVAVSPTVMATPAVPVLGLAEVVMLVGHLITSSSPDLVPSVHTTMYAPGGMAYVLFPATVITKVPVP